jgi:hypothetical protein
VSESSIFRFETAVAQPGNNDVMVWTFTYQVLKPGQTQAVSRYR